VDAHEIADERAAATALALLGADLHDGPLQSLAALALDARALRDQLSALLADERAEELVEGRVDDLLARLEGLDAELRELVASTRPAGRLEHGTLVAALEREAGAFAGSTGIAPSLDLDPDAAAAAAPAASVLVRLARAALANVAAHADAREVVVTLCAEGRETVLTIADDGRGFDPREPPPDGRRRLGLDGMALRAALLGGVLEVQSRPGGPTRVRVRVPRPPAEPA
jgi:signal transduction histidine kinase